jgi:alpha-1,6-mannosyltransferase
MLLPAMASISLLLDGRDRWSGAMLALAIAVKFTAVLMLPFLLLAARPLRRRVRLVGGMVAAAIPLVAMSIVAFGQTIPNLSDQSSLLTDFSIPNLLGLLLGQGGGTPTLVRLGSVAVVLIIAVLIWRRGDWLAGAGWSTLALVCSLAWLVPWYIVWVLPLAALGSSVRLRRATIVFTLFLVLTFVPATSMIMSQLKLSTMNGAASQASLARQARLEH